jgi:hypothetical protein
MTTTSSKQTIRARPRRLYAALVCATFGAAGLGFAGTAFARTEAGGSVEIAQAGDAGERHERRARFRANKARDGERRMSPEERREKRLAHSGRRFQRMDRDSDGALTWDEFWASTIERHERRAERRAARAQRRDLRGDRGEARSERRKGRRGGHAHRELSPEDRRAMKRERAEQRFDRMDANGDGAITWDEYMGAVEQRIEARGERRQSRRGGKGYRNHRGGGGAAD